MFVGLLFARINLGVRYALPIVPLLVVLASRVATLPLLTLPNVANLANVAKVALGLGLVHHVVAAVRIAPHDSAFFSDAVGGPSRGHRYLADSNLDWGQDLGTLGRWLALRERPRRLYLSYFGTS